MHHDIQRLAVMQELAIGFDATKFRDLLQSFIGGHAIEKNFSLSE